MHLLHCLLGLFVLKSFYFLSEQTTWSEQIKHKLCDIKLDCFKVTVKSPSCATGNLAKKGNQYELALSIKDCKGQQYETHKIQWEMVDQGQPQVDLQNCRSKQACIVNKSQLTLGKPHHIKVSIWIGRLQDHVNLTFVLLPRIHGHGFNRGSVVGRKGVSHNGEFYGYVVKSVVTEKHPNSFKEDTVYKSPPSKNFHFVMRRMRQHSWHVGPNLRQRRRRAIPDYTFYRGFNNRQPFEINENSEHRNFDRSGMFENMPSYNHGIRQGFAGENGHGGRAEDNVFKKGFGSFSHNIHQALLDDKFQSFEDGNENMHSNDHGISRGFAGVIDRRSDHDENNFGSFNPNINHASHHNEFHSFEDGLRSQLVRKQGNRFSDDNKKPKSKSESWNKIENFIKDKGSSGKLNRTPGFSNRPKFDHDIYSQLSSFSGESIPSQIEQSFINHDNEDHHSGSYFNQRIPSRTLKSQFQYTGPFISDIGGQQRLQHGISRNPGNLARFWSLLNNNENRRPYGTDIGNGYNHKPMSYDTNFENGYNDLPFPQQSEYSPMGDLGNFNGGFSGSFSSQSSPRSNLGNLNRGFFGPFSSQYSPRNNMGNLNRGLFGPFSNTRKVLNEPRNQRFPLAGTYAFPKTPGNSQLPNPNVRLPTNLLTTSQSSVYKTSSKLSILPGTTKGITSTTKLSTKTTPKPTPPTTLKTTPKPTPSTQKTTPKPTPTSTIQTTKPTTPNIKPGFAPVLKTPSPQHQRAWDISHINAIPGKTLYPKTQMFPHSNIGIPVPQANTPVSQNIPFPFQQEPQTNFPVFGKFPQANIPVPQNPHTNFQVFPKLPQASIPMSKLPNISIARPAQVADRHSLRHGSWNAVNNLPDAKTGQQVGKPGLPVNFPTKLQNLDNQPHSVLPSFLSSLNPKIQRPQVLNDTSDYIVILLRTDIMKMLKMLNLSSTDYKRLEEISKDRANAILRGINTGEELPHHVGYELSQVLKRFYGISYNASRAAIEQELHVIKQHLSRMTAWGPWSAWTSCPKSCTGQGYRMRERKCMTHTQCVGRNMIFAPCPADCSAFQRWGEWSTWTACPVTCGTGISTRNRKCRMEDGSCEGQSSQINPCATTPCPTTTPMPIKIPAIWGSWSECSTTCGVGTRFRQKYCPRSEQGHCTNSVEEEKQKCVRNSCYHAAERHQLQILQGSDAVLQCGVSKNHGIQYWVTPTRKIVGVHSIDKRLRIVDGKLLIREAQRIDHGIYHCVVNNKYTADVELDVLWCGHDLCQHGGRCVTVPSHFNPYTQKSKCMCLPGFYGMFCENKNALPAYMIVIIVVGSLLGAALITGMVLYIICSRTKKNDSPSDGNGEYKTVPPKENLYTDSEKKDLNSSIISNDNSITEINVEDFKDFKHQNTFTWYKEGKKERPKSEEIKDWRSSDNKDRPKTAKRKGSRSDTAIPVVMREQQVQPESEYIPYYPEDEWYFVSQDDYEIPNQQEAGQMFQNLQDEEHFYENYVGDQDNVGAAVNPDWGQGHYEQMTPQGHYEEMTPQGHFEQMTPQGQQRQQWKGQQLGQPASAKDFSVKLDSDPRPLNQSRNLPSVNDQGVVTLSESYHSHGTPMEKTYELKNFLDKYSTDPNDRSKFEHDDHQEYFYDELLENPDRQNESIGRRDVANVSRKLSFEGNLGNQDQKQRIENSAEFQNNVTENRTKQNEMMAQRNYERAELRTEVRTTQNELMAQQETPKPKGTDVVMVHRSTVKKSKKGNKITPLPPEDTNNASPQGRQMTPGYNRDTSPQARQMTLENNTNASPQVRQMTPGYNRDSSPPARQMTQENNTNASPQVRQMTPGYNRDTSPQARQMTPGYNRDTSPQARQMTPGYNRDTSPQARQMTPGYNRDTSPQARQMTPVKKRNPSPQNRQILSGNESQGATPYQVTPSRYGQDNERFQKGEMSTYPANQKVDIFRTQGYAQKNDEFVYASTSMKTNQSFDKSGTPVQHVERIDSAIRIQNQENEIEKINSDIRIFHKGGSGDEDSGIQFLHKGTYRKTPEKATYYEGKGYFTSTPKTEEELQRQKYDVDDDLSFSYSKGYALANRSNNEVKNITGQDMENMFQCIIQPSEDLDMIEALNNQHGMRQLSPIDEEQTDRSNADSAKSPLDPVPSRSAEFVVPKLVLDRESFSEVSSASSSARSDGQNSTLVYSYNQNSSNNYDPDSEGTSSVSLNSHYDVEQ